LARDFGFDKPEDAIGKTIEFLAAPKESEKKLRTKTEGCGNRGRPNFFGIPLDQDSSTDNGSGELVAKNIFVSSG